MDFGEDYDPYSRISELMDAELYNEALNEANSGLSHEPENVTLLVMAGEIVLIYHEELGIDIADAAHSALTRFHKVLSLEPEHAEDWGAAALSYLYLNEHENALDCTNRGLASLSSGVGFGMTNREVHTNVAEEVFDHKVRALLGLDRMEEARKCLFEGLTYCPGSSFLSRHIESLSSIEL